MTLYDLAVIVWGISAAIAQRAYAEALQPKEVGRWVPILIGSLVPGFNTYIAYRYARDKFNWSK